MSQPIKKLPPKPPVEFTPERKEMFLYHYRECGLIYLAAELAGVSSRVIPEHKRLDPEFALRCDEAQQAWIDSVLVQEAVRRGVTGVEEPIIGGKERDQIVAYKRSYSDGLLMQLLKARRSEFRDGSTGAEADGPGASGPVMFIPAAAPATMDDWEAQHGEAAKGGKKGDA